MPRTGKSARDIFAPTTKPAAAESGKRGAGRPPVHEEKWTKVTVVLFDRQIVWLDRLAADIRAKTGAVIKRAELIRALVDAIEDAGVDLTAATSAEDVQQLLAAKVKRR